MLRLVQGFSVRHSRASAFRKGRRVGLLHGATLFLRVHGVAFVVVIVTHILLC